MSQKKRKLQRRVVETIAIKQTEVINHKRLEIWKTIKENWLFLTLMCVGIFLLYLNSLGGAFVSDDYATILNNPDVATWKYAFHGLATTYMVHTLTAFIFGVGPVQYHVFNMLFYMVVCVVSFVFLDYFFGKKLATISMVIFAVHPIHVEAVSWISGKPYLLIAFYVLVATLFFIKFIETENKLYLLISFGSFLLGFFTDKPRPFSLFPLLLLYLLVNKIDVRKHKIFKYWPLFLVVIAIALYVAWPAIAERIFTVNSGYNSSDGIFYNPFFQYPTGLAKYFQLLWIPTDLTLYHTMYIFPTWLNWSILLTYLTMIVYFFFKDKRFFFALVFIIIGILPSMAPVKVSWLVAERYAFLGSLGFCLFLALIIEDISRFFKYIIPITLGCFVTFYGIRVIYRNDDWSTNHKLWVNTCQVSPNSHNAWNNIGDDYDKLAQYDNAIKGFTQSTIVKPNYADAFHNRANIFYKMGRLDLARDSYMTALYFSPQLYQTYLSLIQIDLMEKKMDLALEHAQKALELQPTDPTANYVMAVVYAQRAETDKAKSILEAILKVYPNYKQASDALLQLKTQTAK